MSIQALDSLREIHEIGYVHRDVKPANFAIGALGTPKQRLLHILDFGIARQYLVKDEKGKNDGLRIRKPRKIVPFRGTLRYCSVNAQERREQGRQDDLWSLFYMIVELVKGSLPWTGIVEEEKVRAMKEDFKELFDGLDMDFVYIAEHLSVLRYKSKPDYALLRKLLLNVFVKRKFTPNMKVDWEKGGRYDRYFEKKTSTLPTVTEKDMTAVDLAKILKVPASVERITHAQVVAAGNLSQDDDDLNTAQDDTLIERETNFMPQKVTIRANSVSEFSHIGERRFVPMTLCQQKVQIIEENWKRKEEEALREKLVKKAAAQRRAKADIIVNEDNTAMKSKPSRIQKRSVSTPSKRNKRKG
uniref:Protein kinase domain-containing protein n=1 Tax=Caenorhabditis japonica TaxID=281687 RepID=A0A8R1E1K0_CAEJA